jgi:predicted amidohydrolase YtcJ
MEAGEPIVEALAIRENRIVAIGDELDLHSMLRPGGVALDLRGRTVLPGLIDSHLHFCQYGLRLERTDVYEVPTLEEATRRVAERASVAEPGTWIRGGGWNCNLWGDGAFPHRHDLDIVSLDHPVALSSKDGHSTWVNSAALELAHVTADTPDPPGGYIMRDASGEPTGILQENAAGLIYQVIPPPTEDQMRTACARAMMRARRVGLTGIHDCEDDRALVTFQDLRQRGELSIRVLMHIPSRKLEAAISLGLHDGLGDEWVRIAGVKVFADGALGSRSAWMLSPYESDAGNTGIPTVTHDALLEMVGAANRAGLSVAVHAIGDAANRAVLDAIEASQPPARAGLRNRIEHAQLIDPNDIPRFAQLGVIASMQPIHATQDMEIANLHWGARAKTGYAWRSLLDTGAVLAFGSDAPVEDLSPLVGIHAAVTRRRAEGDPGPEGWHPEQRITVTEAVHAYTLGAAYASGEEQIKGSLAPGKLADLVILDQDIFSIDPMDILHTQVLGTMVDGKLVHRCDSL